MRSISRRAMLGGLGLTATAAGVGYLSSGRRSLQIPDGADLATGPLRLAWSNATEEAMFTLCQDGLFKRFGLDITLVQVDSGARAIDLLKGAAPVDLAVASILDWIPAYHAPGAVPPPAKIVCSIRTGYYRLVVRRDKRINKLADIRGKNVGITRFHGSDRRFLSIRLRRKFMPPTEGISWVELPASEMADAFLDGRIDAFILHDADCWRVLKKVGKMGWNMLDSMTGLARNRIDLALGIGERARVRHPTLGMRLASCFYAAQQAYKSQFNELVAQWQARPNAPPDVAGMLKRQTGGSVLTNQMLRVQIAQYVDEFKLVSLITDAAQSSQVARELTCDV